MREIKLSMKNYEESLKKIDVKKLRKQDELKQKINVAKKHLHKIRIYVRNWSFNDIKEEIHFFKIIKPSIYGQIKFFKYQLAYHTEKPFVSLDKQKKYIHKELRILEFKKKKNINFYRYIKQEETVLDEMYFTRGNEQLALFSLFDFADTDPEFSTSHDLLVGEIITYQLLTEFFKQELHCLANMEVSIHDSPKNPFENLLSWTASKTDLIELIYAIKYTGAINGGDIQLKELIEVFENLFSVDLGNYYKTYSEIKNRQNHQTKFLSNLSMNLISKLEIDDI